MRNKQVREKLLMIPGPTIMPPAVQEALARPQLGHRSEEFAEVFKEVAERLKQVFQTQNEVLIYTASGTGAMEASVVNLLSPGDVAINVSIGVFGDRFGQILRNFGAEVVEVKFLEGTAADAERVKKAIEATPAAKALYITFNETSTGVVNELEPIAEAARKAGLLVVVDAISGLVAMDLPVDEWGLDVVVAGSQKAFGMPPGLAFCCVSERAWEAHKTAEMPRFYWDFEAMKKAQAKGSTAWTPSVNLVYALGAAVELILEEGLENCFARHKRLAEAIRRAMEALGLELFAEAGHRSQAVTSVKVPEGLDVGQVRDILNERFDIVTAGGQRQLKGKIFRIGHLGFVQERDVLATVAAFEAALKQAGWRFTPGAGVTAALEALDEGGEV